MEIFFPVGLSITDGVICEGIKSALNAFETAAEVALKEIFYWSVIGIGEDAGRQTAGNGEVAEGTCCVAGKVESELKWLVLPLASE